MLFAQRQQCGNVGVGELIYFRDRGPRFRHPAADRAPERRHLFPTYRTPFGKIDRFAWRRRARRRRLRGRSRAVKRNLLQTLNVIAHVTEIDSAAGFAAFDSR